MEIWFVSAVLGAIFAGLSNFYFKQAAARGYSAELFGLYGALASVFIVGLLLVYFQESIFHYGVIGLLVFVGGFIASFTNILKVHALRFIDSTIYFPLYKLIAPALAILFGLFFFAESFLHTEWIGMLIGLFIPLLLITKAEHGRQNHLFAGVGLVLVTGVFSATTAALNKYAIDSLMPMLVTLTYASFGLTVGTISVMIYRRGAWRIWSMITEDSSIGLFVGATLRAVLISAALGLMLTAYEYGGTLAVVQTIHSMYILVPIVLSIIFYQEHWNLQKAVAIILSGAALALLG